MKKINDGPKLQKSLFHYALRISRQRSELLEFHRPVGIFLELQYKIFDKIIFSKIRDRLGGRMKGLTCGGAAMNLKIVQFFTDIGLLCVEGFGLTETSPVICFSGPSWKDRRLGCVGVVVPGCEVRIVDPVTRVTLPHDQDGEITVWGDNVMVGYHGNPQADREVFEYDDDGKRFFKTGDQGRLIEGKYLKITGRIKELFKLENGKYIVPTVCEDSVNRSRFIAQSMMCGDNKPFPVLLIVPDLTEIKQYLLKNSKANKVQVDGDPQTLMTQPAVQQLLSEEILRATVDLKGFEKPKYYSVVYEPFTVVRKFMNYYVMYTYC
jgi:long-chain acyl-CoA synthetase